MTTSGTGLSDKQRFWLAVGIGVFLTVDLSLVGLPEEQRPPLFVITTLGVVATAVGAFERLSGIRDATSAAVAKKTDPESNNTRDTSESIGPK